MGVEKIVNILGINISITTYRETLRKIEEILRGSEQKYFVTPNPEIILTALKDEELFYIINKADLALADGFGLKLAALFQWVNLRRVTGADLLDDIFSLAEEKEKKILILNWEEGLTKKEEIEKEIKFKYNNLVFLIKDIKRDGGGLNFEAAKEFNADILITNLGAPWQEKLIYKIQPKLSSVNFAIGIGGALDFFTHKLKRAPALFRFLGIEWSWRLIKQPWRIKRIYNAVVVFSCKYLKWRFILPFFYRLNVACILYKNEGGDKKIFIVERGDEPGHWQLPQGGTDGLPIKKAGEKELQEETSQNKFKIIKTYKNVHRYKFFNKKTPIARHRGGIYNKRLGYKGQKQGLCVAVFEGSDEDIKINYWNHGAWKWVDDDKLVDSVHEMRKEATQKFYNKFKELFLFPSQTKDMFRGDDNIQI